MMSISSTSFSQPEIIVLAQRDISNISVQEIDAVEESKTIQSTMVYTSIHINPYFDAVQLNLDRFDARDFYRFANIGKNTSFRKSPIFDSKTGAPEYHEDILRALAQTSTRLPVLNYFLVGVYNELMKYVKILNTDDNGIAPGSTILDWSAFCRDPYTIQDMSDIHTEYDLFQTFGSGKWIVGPGDDGALSWNALNWFLSEVTPNLNKPIGTGTTSSRLNQLSIYEGSEFMEPDYSIERFEQDYLGIMTAIIKTAVGGHSVFFLLWPVNGSSSALYGLLSLFFKEFRISKDLKKSPIDPGVIIFASDRRNINLDLVKHLCRQDRFLKNLSFFEHVADRAFDQYFEKIRPAYNKHFEEVARRWQF